MPKDIATAPIEKVLVSRPTFLQRVASFRNTLLALIICFAVLTFFVKQFDYFKLDLRLSLMLQSYNFFWFDMLMVLISKLGDIKWGGLGILIFISVAAVYKKWKIAFMIFVTTFSMTVLNQTLKHLVNRPRPDPGLINVVGVPEKLDSFPSGHVMFIVGFYGFLLFIVYTQFKKTHWLRNLLIALFSTMIVLIGVSRIYLGAHWFSDVLGAYLLGFFWLMIMTWVYKKLELP